MRPTAVLLPALLLLVACAADAVPAGPPSAPAPSDVHGEWELVDIRLDGEDVPVPEVEEGSLVIEARRLGGRSFCNGFGGGYRLAGDRLEIEDLLTTLVACTGPVARAEGAYLRALSAGDVRVAREQDELVVTGDSVVLTFRPRPPVQAPDLVGTRWKLQGVGTSGVSTIALGPTAPLEFRDDGSFTGGTGCRSFTGSWTITDERVASSLLHAEDQECDLELREQDALVTGVLGRDYAVRLTEGRLTLTADDGDTLEYVPE